MKSTMILSTGIAEQQNVATPYTTSYTGTLQKVPYDNWNNLAPAASIISNVSDLSHWLLMQLDSGRYNGQQVLPFSVLLKTRDISIVTGSRKSAIFPTHIRGYGLGISVTDYNGHAVYSHTGGAAGMVSNVCFVPEKRLGIAILTNNDNQGFFEALRYQILDAYLGVPYVDRSLQQLTGFKKEMESQLSEIAAWRKRVKGVRPTLPISAYTGIYNNDLYGTISLKQDGNKLTVNFNTHPDLYATLEYMDNGAWLMQYNNIEYGIHAVQFEIADGKVKAITTKQNEYVEMDGYRFVKR
jgi:CubicO group peptidase (beta-lactamase class C family)